MPLVGQGERELGLDRDEEKGERALGSRRSIWRGDGNITGPSRVQH